MDSKANVQLRHIDKELFLYRRIENRICLDTIDEGGQHLLKILDLYPLSVISE